jgi:hypothetical protein
MADGSVPVADEAPVSAGSYGSLDSAEDAAPILILENHRASLVALQTILASPRVAFARVTEDEALQQIGRRDVVSVIKMREGAGDPSVREFRIGSSGFAVSSGKTGAKPRRRRSR